MSIATVEIRSFSGPDLVELDGVNRPTIVRLNVGPAGAPGPAGPNSVTSATTSNGTCDLWIDTLRVGTGTVSGENSIAIGTGTVASGNDSFAGGQNTTASSPISFAFGNAAVASGGTSFALGDGCTASGDFSFTNGITCEASGTFAFAQGNASTASGDSSRAVGTNAKAIHQGASVESDSQVVDVESTAIDQKTFRFENGYRFLGGSATFDANVTVSGILYADHIHGNLAGSVYSHVRAGETLAKGDPVYVSGSHGTGANLIPIVSKADASNSAKMPAIGIMDADLANNANGHMVITGTIADLNTAAYSVNDTLYVATGGGLTATPPAANSQPVARVDRSNANNGALIVKVNGLASNGGNGVSDANKLARFSSTGGISQTGGTMTDTTYAGTASFTSTTRPTSAGTGTPAATSLITRADGDARFLLKPFIGILGTAVNSDTNTTTYKTVTELQATLAAGTYLLECQLIHDGNTNYATSGVKDRINVVSGSATAVGFLYRIFDNATTTTTFPSGKVSTNPLVESAPTNRSQSTLRTGILTVTSTAVIAVQIAQTAAVAASNTTLQVGSYLKITQIS